MRFKSQLQESFLLYRRYYSILVAVFIYPIIIVILYFFRDSFQPQLFLTPVILFLFWSLGTLITNLLAIVPRDLLSSILFPIKWLYLIFARNSVVFSVAILSIFLILSLSHFLYKIDISSLVLLFIHSVIVMLVVLGLGNMLSVKFPKPFPQNAFSWKGILVVFSTIMIYGILGISSLLGGFWSLFILIAMFILSGFFYQFSLSLSSRILRNNLQDIMEVVNEWNHLNHS